MKDQPSTSGDRKEPVRPKTIPDDFIYDPDTESYYPPGEPSTFDAAAWLREFEEARRRGEFGGGLISVDELRAAGALDCPPAWRKSLSAGCKSPEVQRDLFSLFGDDDSLPEEQQPTRSDADGNASADELP